MKRAAFRVDASLRMGTGHVSRCLVLASVLRQRGVQCHFIHRRHPGHAADRIRAAGFPVHLLPPPPDDERWEENYRLWLGVPEETDAAESSAILATLKPDTIIVDHYGLGRTWEEATREHTRRMVVIDDIANRHHACDALIDQNYFAKQRRRYEGLVPSDCDLLTGPHYALIHPAYRRLREVRGPRRGPVGRILFFYGGTAPEEVLRNALQALTAPAFSGLAVDVVIPGDGPRARLAAEFQDRPRTTFHGPLACLAPLMADADLALGAGGVTTWERCTVGLPAIVTAVAQNQTASMEELARTGAIVYLGYCTEAEEKTIAEALQDLLASDDRLLEMSKTARDITDGLGVYRVAEILYPENRGESLRIRAFETEATRTETSIETTDGVPLATIEADESRSGTRITVRPADYAPWQPELHELIRALTSPSVPEISKRILARFHVRLDRPKSGNPNGGRKPLRLTIVSDEDSWINTFIPVLVATWLTEGHAVRWIHRSTDLAASPGDFCFLLGCGQKLSAKQLLTHTKFLVVHESDLPRGRGWSPVTWQVLEGCNRIQVTLLEAVEDVDAGDIYLQTHFDLDGHELIDEIRKQQAQKTFELCKAFVNKLPGILRKGIPQKGTPTFFSRRTQEHSRVDPNKTIADLFPLLRVVDNNRYPAFFELAGNTYVLHIRKAQPSKSR